jgi:arylformamidase
MQIIDLTHTINEDMTIFPGTRGPSIEINSIIEKEGYAEKELTLFTHTGTHIDAPCHLLKDGKSLDEYPVNKFYGKGVIIDCHQFAGMEITKEFFQPHELKINAADFLILKSGWNKKWESDAYFIDFPTLNPEATEWLTGFNLKAIGIDSISLDKIDSKGLPNHHIVLSHEILIIENLTNLDELNSAHEFIFQCFPLKIEKADGSPVRALAIYS